MTDLTVTREAVSAAAKAGAHARQIVLRPGTILSVSADETIAEVQIDGDLDLGSGGDDVPETSATGAQMLYPTGVRSGDRVMVMFVPPNGAFVIGRRAGDYEDWIYVGQIDPDGDSQGPSFGTGWTNATGTGDPFTDVHSQVSFRRLGRYVELRGRAWRTSGVGTTIFTLPDDYRPQNRIAVPVLGGVGGTVGINYVSITRTGLVIPGSLVGVDDPTGSLFLDGVTFSVDDTLAEEVP